MAKASKPVEIIAKHLTKQEIEERKQAEQKLKGNDDLVYKIPQCLSKEEKKIYKFLINELQASGILCNLDITILEITANAIASMRECTKLINKYGVVITKENGDMIKNPACTAYKDYNAIFNKCCIEIGLSPSARTKLANINVQAQEQKDDPVLKILNRSSDAS
ncbi:MAG TPA: phage terminase small subunit P27 family [Clostridiaceae bacterium]|jgi:P27 family predicted phage terminase small subunit|nr:phage terminase small subunit P27 family [Clostridiaceae bacterium]